MRMIETQECYVREIHQYQKRDLPGTRFDYPAPLLNVRAYGALTHHLATGTRYTKLHLHVSIEKKYSVRFNFYNKILTVPL